LTYAKFGMYVRDARRMGFRAARTEEVAVSATTPDDRAASLSRRQLLAAAGLVAAGTVADAAEIAEARPAAYPRLRVIELRRLRVNRPHAFDYPLRGQSSVVVDLGHRVPGGAGPRRSIVAYSTLCQHMGCPVAYDRRARVFACPCHQTRYDPAREASIMQGVATRALPRVRLRVKNGAVYAVGVDGLIYGYRSNLTPGRRVGT
jgi:arsenite oxidase small subunit